MRHLAILLAVLLPFKAHALVNSVEVSDAEFAAAFPWMVALVHPDKKRNACGAVMIAPEWALTVAHCLEGKTVVLVGDPDRRKARRISIAQTISHPEYSQGPRVYDVALVRLEEPVAVDYVLVPDEAVAEELILPGRPAELLGWGRTETLDPPVYRLRKGQVKLNKLQFIDSVYSYTYRGGGPCKLDSGGPMLRTTEDGRSYVVGLASATGGGLCEHNGGTAFYVNVASVRAFILQHVGSLQAS